MTTCNVCCEKLNKINHKEVNCPFCDLVVCRVCVQKYMLSSFQDPHCMSCKTLWNREFIDSFCTKYFRNTDFKLHRENILLEREKYIDAIVGPQSYHEINKIILSIKDKYKKINLTEFEAIEKFDELKLIKNRPKIQRPTNKKTTPH